MGLCFYSENIQVHEEIITRRYPNVFQFIPSLFPHKQEDEGDKLAGDADTAVLKAKTGSQVKMRREWFI